jgi:hypothetical protein
VSCGVEVVACCLQQRLCQPDHTLFGRSISKFFVCASNQRARCFEVTLARVRERLARVERTEVTSIRRQVLESRGEFQVPLCCGNVVGPKMHLGREEVRSGEFEAVLGVIEHDDGTPYFAERSPGLALHIRKSCK